MMGPGMMGRGGFMMMCDPRSAGFAEWRIGSIERLVQLTAAQRQALEDLRTASAKAAEPLQASCLTELPTTMPARLEAMEKRMEAMLAAVKTVRPSFDAFYASLSDDQKRRLDVGGPRWRWRWNRGDRWMN
jgi:hypothetical protein